MKTKLTIFALLLSTAIAFGQNKPLRIGYTQVDYLLSLMPESKQVESELKAYKTQLENQLQTKMKDFQAKMDSYEKGYQTMADVIRADKEKELQNLEEQIREFEKNAQASLQKKEATLLEPLLKKIQKNIDLVAEESGFTYIFNIDAGLGTTPILLHGPESDNVTDLVLKKMGITPPAKKTETSSTPKPAGK